MLGDWVRQASDKIVKQVGLSREEARQEARIMVEEVCGLTFAEQIGAPRQVLSHNQVELLDLVLERRLQREPLTSIFKSAYFYGRRFGLNEATLAPRPETELLVDWALELIKEGKAGKRLEKDNFSFAEFFCGSGAPGLSLLAETMALSYQADLSLSDLSLRALEQARENAQNHGLEELINIQQADIFPVTKKRFDIILANPPYIKHQELDTLMTEVKAFDPKLALDGGEDGLDFYRKLASGVHAYLKEGGWLLMEHGQGQADQIKQIFLDANSKLELGVLGRDKKKQEIIIENRNDYAGIDRMIAVRYC